VLMSSRKCRPVRTYITGTERSDRSTGRILGNLISISMRTRSGSMNWTKGSVKLYRTLNRPSVGTVTILYDFRKLTIRLTIIYSYNHLYLHLYWIY